MTGLKQPSDYGKRSPIVRVSVTEEHINRAIRNNSSHCMIADTIKSQNPDYDYVSVDIQTIRFSHKAKGLRYVYLTPRVAQQALVLFDEGKKMKPFSFVLRSAHITSMQQTKRPKGTPLKKRIPLGSRRILENKHNKIPDIIGGKAIAKHPSSKIRGDKKDGFTTSAARTFGMRAFTRGDLEDVGFTAS